MTGYVLKTNKSNVRYIVGSSRMLSNAQLCACITAKSVIFNLHGQRMKWETFWINYICVNIYICVFVHNYREKKPDTFFSRQFGNYSGPYLKLLPTSYIRRHSCISMMFDSVLDPKIIIMQLRFLALSNFPFWVFKTYTDWTDFRPACP